MNKKMNLIKLHLITGETIETVEEVISHESALVNKNWTQILNITSV